MVTEPQPPPTRRLPTSSWRNSASRRRRPSSSKADRTDGSLHAVASVLALDHEVRTADRSRELGLLPRELELVGELVGDVHPVGELESDRPLPALGELVHHVNREPALVEDVREL